MWWFTNLNSDDAKDALSSQTILIWRIFLLGTLVTAGFCYLAVCDLCFCLYIKFAEGLSDSIQKG